MLQPVNSFQVPNALVDHLMRQLTGRELVCLLLIIRKTRGWHKELDAISISQFKEFTGMNRDKTILKVLSSLEAKGLIARIRRPGKMTQYKLGIVFDIGGSPPPGAVGEASGSSDDQGRKVPGAESATSGVRRQQPGAESATSTNGTRCQTTKKTQTKDTLTNGAISQAREHDFYPAWFDKIWKARPVRMGSDPKKLAFQEGQARIAAGVDVEAMLEGVIRYRKFCEATGKIDTEKVMQLRRLLGPEKEYANAWQFGPAPVRQNIDIEEIAERSRAAFVTDPGFLGDGLSDEQ